MFAVNVVVTGPVAVTQSIVQPWGRKRIENVLPCSGEGTGDQEDRSGFIDDADPSRNFCVARVVENVCSSEARSEILVVNQSVPVEADSGFDQQAVGDAPAILDIGGDFRVVLLNQRGRSEGRVASTGEVGVKWSGQAEIGGGERVAVAQYATGWRL